MVGPPFLDPRRQLSVRVLKAAQSHLAEVREANEGGKVKRPELIAAVFARQTLA